MKKRLLSMMLLLVGGFMAASAYDLFVGGVQVMQNGRVTGNTISGSVTYDNSTKTLTLTDATISSSSANNGISNNDIEDLKIVISGRCSIKGAKGIRASKKTTVTGKDFGSNVTIEATETLGGYGIYLDVPNVDFVFEKIWAWVKGKTYGIYSDKAGTSLSVYASSLSVSQESKSNSCITGLKEIWVRSVNYTSYGNIYNETSKKLVDKTGANATSASFMPALRIGRYILDVNRLNALNSNETLTSSTSSLTGIASGTVTYKGQLKELWLDNVTINDLSSGSDYAGIESYDGTQVPQPLHIYVFGTNKITCTRYPIYVNHQDLTIEANSSTQGTLELTSKHSAFSAIRMDGDDRTLTIETVGLKATAQEYPIFNPNLNFNVIVNQSEVDVKATASGNKAFNRIENCIMNGCDVDCATTPVYYDKSNKNFVNSAGTTASRVVIKKPTTTYPVQILGKSLNNLNCKNFVVGGMTTGKITYDPTSNPRKLTLDGVTMASDEEIGIRIDDQNYPTTIELKGENSITTKRHALWIRGSGIKPVTITTSATQSKPTTFKSTGATAIYNSTGNALTIDADQNIYIEGTGSSNAFAYSGYNGEQLVLKKKGSNSRVYMKGANGVLDDATLTLTNMDFYYKGNTSKETPGCYYDSNKIYQNGGTLVKNQYVCFAGITKTYGLTVAGTPVTNCNYYAIGSKYITAGGGTAAVFYDASNMLTLTNATIDYGNEGINGIKSVLDGFVLRSMGSCKITSSHNGYNAGNTAIYLGADATITGDGSLTVDKLPILCYDNCTLTIKDAKDVKAKSIQAAASKTCALVVNNSNVTINSSVPYFSQVTWTNCNLLTPWGGHYDTTANRFVDADNNTVRQVVFGDSNSSSTMTDAQGLKYRLNADGKGCYVSGVDKQYGTTSFRIPSTYNGVPVTKIGGMAFWDSGVTAVTIPGSVEDIGEQAFYWCTGLTSLTLPEGLETIGDKAFQGCTALTAIEIPESVFDLGYDAFASCSNLTSVTVKWSRPLRITENTFGGNEGRMTLHVPEGTVNTYKSSNVWKNFGKIDDGLLFTGTLSDSQGIKYTANNDEATCYVSGHEENYNAEIVIPAEFEGRRVTSIGSWAFYQCAGLTSLTINESVAIIKEHAFTGCQNLANVHIAGCVKTIGESAFQNCPALTNLEILEGVTTIGSGAFDYCIKLSKVTIPEGVTEIGGAAFRECHGLTTITIPASVTKIGVSAFSFTNLTSVTVAWETPLALTDNTFDYVSLDKATLHVPEGTKAAYKAAAVWKDFGRIDDGLPPLVAPESDEQGVIYASNHDGKTCFVHGHEDNYSAIITIPEEYEGLRVTSIGQQAFYECGDLKSITIPQSVTTFGDEVFRGCGGLESVLLSEGLEKIGGGAFYECSALKEIVIPEGVTEIGYTAFYGCSSLTSATIPKSLATITSAAFLNCSALTLLNISPGVKTIGELTFGNCSSLTAVAIPSSVTSIEVGAFQGCTSLTSVTVNWETPLALDAERSAFIQIPLEQATLYVPDGTKAAYKAAAVWKDFGKIEDGLPPLTNPESDEQGVIYTATGDGLTCYVSGHEDNYSTTITIPEEFEGLRVTSIGQEAFYECSNLTSVTIPQSVTSIGYCAFGLCGLTELTIPTSITSIGKSAFFKCLGLTSITIPSSVTSLGDFAFYECTGITSVTVEWETPLALNADNSPFFFIPMDNATLYVPEGTKAAYKAAEVWKKFGTIDDGIEEPDPYWVAYDTGEAVMYDMDVDENGMINIPINVVIDDEEYPVTELARGAFQNKTELVEATIPETVKKIGEGAFAGCRNLRNLYIKSQTPPTISSPDEARSMLRKANGTGVKAFEGVDKETCVLHVPYGTAELYRQADGWKEFANIVEMEDLTAVNGVMANGTVTDVYDMSGRKVRRQATTLKDLPKGVYIIEGRKVIVK
jgi:hypothetical protein